MTEFASFAGQRVIAARVVTPTYGAWTADVSLAQSADIPSTASPLTIGNLTLLGTVFRAASFAGSKSARIVGGYGGWGNPVPAQAYRGANVRVSTVLKDAAASVGERVQVDIADTNLGSFTRVAGNASNVLRAVGGPQWWIAPDGITHIGPRPSDPIATPFEVIGWSGKSDKFTIATEDLAAWQPERTFIAPTISGTKAISYVSIDMSNDGHLRLEVLAS